MNRAAVFFDRDNTLIANEGYLGNPAGVVLIPGAAQAIARLRAKGYAIVTISNQSGVARGMFPEEAVYAVNSRLDEMLLDIDAAAIIDRHEFCPYHPDATVERYKQESELRKPKPGMIYQAADRLKLDRFNSWVIGDAPRDIAAGHTAGCRTILFSDPALKSSPASQEPVDVEPDFTAGSLEEAVDIIEKNTMNEPETEIETSTETAQSADENALATDNADQPVTPEESGESAVPPQRKMTFAERVRAGTYQPARVPAAPGAAVAERPRKEASDSAKTDRPARPVDATAPSAHPKGTEISPELRLTEPVDPAELIEPLLQQILEEVRLMRQQNHRGTEFSVTKLLAGIVQILVLPALFIAYLHRDTPTDLQSLLLLATFLQTLTISLYIMGKQP